jgi:hypothetical protein
MERDAAEPQWTTSVVEIDGRPVTIYTSNVPPPGTPRSIYWFSSTPTTADEAGAISDYIGAVHGLLDRERSAES